MERVRCGYNPMHPDTFQEDFELAQSDLGEAPLEALCPYFPKNQQPETWKSFEENSIEQLHVLTPREGYSRKLQREKKVVSQQYTRELEDARTTKKAKKKTKSLTFDNKG